MKTERRHELQTNVLADWLGHKTEALRPYLKLIIGGVVAVFIVAIAATFISNQQLEQSSRGWADYFAASTGDSPDRLRSVAEDHAGTLPGLWASQREGDLELARGIRALYTNRGESTEALASAKKLYELVATGAAGQPILKQAAEFGAAQASEAEGDLEKAKEYYEKAIATAKDSSVGKQSQVRLDLLNDKDAAEFLIWFVRQTPQPRTPAGGFPHGFPGGADDGLDLPRDLRELPGRPDVSLPEAFDVPSDRASSLPIAEPPAVTPAKEGTEPEGTEPEGTEPEGTEPEATTPKAAESPEASPAEAEPPEASPPEASPAEPSPAEPAPAPAKETPQPEPAADSATPAATPDPPAPTSETPSADAPAESSSEASSGNSPASE